MDKDEENVRLRLAVAGGMANLIMVVLFLMGWGLAIDRLPLGSVIWRAAVLILYVALVTQIVVWRLPVKQQSARIRENMWAFEMMMLPGFGFVLLLVLLWFMR